MNGAQEVARCLVVARCNGAVLLEPGKEVLDQVPRFVQVPIMVALVPARFETGNHHSLARFLQRLDHPFLCVISLVSDDHGAWRTFEQHVCALRIMCLPGRQMKTGWVSQCIDRGVDFGCQAAAAAPNGLALIGPLFFAPALCWWALMMVESIQSRTRCPHPGPGPQKRAATRQFGSSASGASARA